MRVGLNVNSPSHIIIIIVYHRHLHSLSLFADHLFAPSALISRLQFVNVKLRVEFHRILLDLDLEKYFKCVNQ